MGLTVNGQKADDFLILEEMEKMRPEYEKRFRDMDPRERELQLLDWAKENVVERLLMEQEAAKDPDPVPGSEIEKAFLDMQEQYGGPILFRRDSLSDPDAEKRIRAALEKELRVRRFVSGLISDVAKPDPGEALAYFREHEELVEYSDDETEQAAAALWELRKNEKLEAFLDELKEKSNITFVVDRTLKKRLEAVKKAGATGGGDVRQHGKTKKKLQTLLIKPAGPDCNMACVYCYYLEKREQFGPSSKHRMDGAVLKETLRQALECASGPVTFCWQGGEPTLMGLSFYEKAVALEKKYGQGQPVANAIQTNGLLIDHEWASFFRKNRFLVGLSLDGPPRIHDRYRLGAGAGTCERVADSARLLLKSGVEVNALTVVTALSADFPEEIVAFHKDLGLTHMQFIPCVETDPRTGTVAPYSVGPEQYGRFLCRLFDLWIQDFRGGIPSFSVRFFESVFHSYASLEPPECTLLRECGNYLVVEHNGDIYPCDFFVTPELKLGNVMEGRLADFLNSPGQAAFGRLKGKLPPACAHCAWLLLCRGGCTKDRVKDSAIPFLCRSYMLFFEHADEHYRRLAAAWRAGNEGRGSHAPVHPRGTANDAPGGRAAGHAPAYRGETGRNDPCPCGSGVKYKKCCGRKRE